MGYFLNRLAIKQRASSPIVLLFTIDMRAQVKKTAIILYLLIALVYLFVWIHSDLAKAPAKLPAIFLNNFWQLACVLGLNFLYFEFLLPLVITRKRNRVVVITASLLLCLVVLTIALYGWRVLGYAAGIYHPLQKTVPAIRFSDAIRFVPGAFLLFAAFRLFFAYIQLKYEGQLAELQRKQAELAFLKSQINPHFLFNTLNNIYSLSQYQPELVSASVLRLSKIMRYLLYETGHELIPVDKEISIINDYLDLERLRYNRDIVIAFTWEMGGEPAQLPPLLLLPLVENAFKHGVSQVKGDRYVRIELTLEKQQLRFMVENSCDPDGPNEVQASGKIGLANLQRQLRLLYKEFTFHTEQKEEKFTALLTINLASHV